MAARALDAARPVVGALRVAFVLDEPLSVGGSFQQTLSTITALATVERHQVLVLTSRPGNVEIVRKSGLECHLFRFGKLRRALTRLAGGSRLHRIYDALPGFLRKVWGPFDAIVDAHRADLVFCFFCSWVPDCLYRRPFITTVYDLCHREHCEFPEVGERFEFENRDRIFRQVLPRAVAVLVSSPLLARRLTALYGVDESRMVTLPFLPAPHARGAASAADIARVRQKYALPSDYVFYPAQFWPHKNHVYILEALTLLPELSRTAVHAVFCGSDFGNAAHVRRMAERLGVADRVRFLGFVPSEDMGALYTGARALVMPTYFGPTNLPPLEAMAVGCPVIYSDIPEFRADLGDAALYCDLGNPASLAEHIRSLIEDQPVAQRLRDAGAELLRRGSATAYVHALQGVLDRYAHLRRRWAGC